MKFPKYGLVIFIILMILMHFVGGYFNNKSHEIAMNSEIIGVIQNITYDEKKVATIQVKRKNFF